MRDSEEASSAEGIQALVGVKVAAVKVAVKAAEERVEGVQLVGLAAVKVEEEMEEEMVVPKGEAETEVGSGAD